MPATSRTTFTKTAPADELGMFQAEAEGLAEIAGADVIRVPEVYDVGVRDGMAFIDMERIAFESASPEIEAALGRQLAEMHAVTAKQFGWHRDNTIGPTPQVNRQSTDWVGFFREQRLEFQLQLAASNGYGGVLQVIGARLCEQLPLLFEGYTPDASLLHGDLWGGTWGASNGEPVIFDPAVYYGDRESDIAMTRLFGGFGRPFYRAYNEAAPMANGYEHRQDLYQLYHVLNHLNLFGSGYLGQAKDLLRRLLSVCE